MEDDESLPVKPGRSRSGAARMGKLSPEERKQLAKKGAERRWAEKKALSATSNIILYQSEDQKTRIDVLVEDETVWLTQAQMAELFQTSKQNVSTHIKNVYAERELLPEATVKEYLTVRLEGERQVERSVEHYNLDIIISVGYRVKSHRGTQFRIWATQRLREYIIKGFTLDDERLKNTGKRNDYFDELLRRVREIRTSERNFYRKVTDVYSTSVDYDAEAAITKQLFATVQNKFHHAIHGHTAAELIAERADASRPNMGLTSWEGQRVKKADVTVAKNYLTAEEIENLNLLVDQYLSFAELQARQRRVMYMKDWVSKLDDFLKLNDRDILNHAARVSKRLADEIAEKQYTDFDARRKGDDTDLSDFDRFVRRIESERSED